MVGRLRYFPITHARIQGIFDPELHADRKGYSAVRYLRFFRPVRLKRLELPIINYGRWVPNVPCHPAHLLVSVLDKRTGSWKTVKEVQIKRDARISGQGLSRKTSLHEMEEHFANLTRLRPHHIDLDGLVTNHLRVECDREHPVWPNHGECNGGAFNVPYGILNGLRAIGEPLRAVPEVGDYLPLLKKKQIILRAPRQMQVMQTPVAVTFAGEKLSVGFDVARPVITHLGWDAFSRGHALQNRLLDSMYCWQIPSGDIGGLSGPLLRTLDGNYGAHRWTGTVSVHGNCIRYQNLHCNDWLSIDATFTVMADRIRMELVQTCRRRIAAIEFETWRFLWSLRTGMSSTVSMPSLREGRNGDLLFPSLFAGDGTGHLLCSIVEGDRDRVCLQTESYREHGCRSSGIVLAPFPNKGQPITIEPGTTRAVLELRVGSLRPQTGRKRKPVSSSLQRAWGSVFTTFRGELGGFSNSAISVNCHLETMVAGDMVVLTEKPRQGPDPLNLAAFTVARALMGGGGYGYHRNLYLDSDPVLVSSAGRIFQCGKNCAWLQEVKPGLLAAVERMLAIIDKNGLAVCRDLSGNSGSYKWSSNLMDVVGFGHIDAYVNAWTYRALRNADVLLSHLREKSCARLCREKAERLRRSYARALVNPDTGWVAGWRSRDGALHDYAFLFVNGPACCFGLLDRQDARRALLNLEQLRDKVGPGTGYLGVPHNLLPLRKEDHMLAKRGFDEEPTFEFYTDGALSAVGAAYYLRALSIYGLHDRARTLADDLSKGFADGVFYGGIDRGSEFHRWDGVETGYEGTFGLSFPVLYSIAVVKGIIEPPDPEWWPKG